MRPFWPLWHFPESITCVFSIPWIVRLPSPPPSPPALSIDYKQHNNSYNAPERGGISQSSEFDRIPKRAYGCGHSSKASDAKGGTGALHGRSRQIVLLRGGRSLRGVDFSTGLKLFAKSSKNRLSITAKQ